MLIHQSTYYRYLYEFCLSTKNKVTDTGIYIGDSISGTELWYMDDHDFNSFRLELIYD